MATKQILETSPFFPCIIADEFDVTLRVGGPTKGTICKYYKKIGKQTLDTLWELAVQFE